MQTWDGGLGPGLLTHFLTPSAHTVTMIIRNGIDDCIDALMARDARRQAHGTRNSNTSLRRLVLDRDGGVCSGDGCGRDCLTLVSRLTAVQNREVNRELQLSLFAFGF